MNDLPDFVPIRPQPSEPAAATNTLGIATGAWSSMTLTPIGLSVLALSLLAAVRFNKWRACAAQQSDMASVLLAGSSTSVRDTDAPRESARGSGSQTVSDRKRRSKLRKRKGKDTAKEVLLKPGQSSKPITADIPSRHQQSPYASPPAYGPLLESSADGERRPYAASAGSGSAAPSALGDDPSSSSVSDMGEQGDFFDGLPPRRRGADEDDASVTTPIATGRRRVPRPAPALAALKLPSIPPRPSKLTIRTLNAFADFPVFQSSSVDAPTPSPSRTITSVKVDRSFANARPHYSSHSPAPSNATSSTTTNLISGFSTASSSASSQLSPTTPPATLTATNSHSLPARGLISASPGVDDDSREKEEYPPDHQHPEVNMHIAMGIHHEDPEAWIEGIESPNSDSTHAHQRATPDQPSRERPRSRAGYRGGGLGRSVSLTGAGGSREQARARSTELAYHIATSISAPVTTGESAWDDSLDWRSTSETSADGEHSQRVEGNVAEAVIRPSSSGGPSQLVFPDLLPLSSPWDQPESHTSANPTAGREGERVRSASNAAPPGSFEGSDPTSSSIHDEVDDADEQPPATPDILFPSLDDPPTSPYSHQQYENSYPLSSPGVLDLVDVGTEGATSLEAALHAAKMREERWRAECTRLVAEYERLRWAWNRRETEIQNQMFQFRPAYGGTQAQPNSQTQVAPQRHKQQNPGKGQPGGGKQSQQLQQQPMTPSPGHAPTSPYGLPGGPVPVPMNMNMHVAMSMGMNPNMAGGPNMNGMVPMMGFPPMRGSSMQSPTGSVVPPGSGLGEPSLHPNSTSPSRQRNYPRGNRASSRSRSRAPSPFTTSNASGGDAGRAASSPKRQTGPGSQVAALSPMTATPPAPLLALPPSRSASSSSSSGFRYPASNSATTISEQGPSTETVPRSPFEDLPSSSVLEVEEECDEGEDEDGIPDGLASAILKNPPRNNSPRSPPRASNVLAAVAGGISALQQLPTPIPPLTRPFSSSSTTSSEAAGLANLIMTQTSVTKNMPLVEEDSKLPGVEKIVDKSPDLKSPPVTSP